MLRSRSARTRIQLVQNDGGDGTLTAALNLAHSALEIDARVAPLPTAPAAFDAAGIPLANLTQKNARPEIIF